MIVRIIERIGIVMGTTVREKNSNFRKTKMSLAMCSVDSSHQYIGTRINGVVKIGMVNAANTICAAAHPLTACLVPALHMMASAR